MANFRKSFNFRTGLQVDNDNFVVNPNGLVGIGTSIPEQYLLNVHGDTRVTGLVTTRVLYAGIGTIGVLTATNANITGVLTATELRIGNSPIVNNLVGYAYTAWITTDGGVGLHTVSRIGIGTDSTPPEQLRVIGDARVTGIITAENGFSGTLNVSDLSGTVPNDQLPDDITKPTGTFTASSFVGPLTGNADTASNLTGIPDIVVMDIQSTNLNVTGIITAQDSLDVGIAGTAFTALSSGRIGVGTALPTSDIQIRKPSGSLLEVISDSGESKISIGQSIGVGNSSAVIRYGSSTPALDIINRDTGNINMVLHGGGTGINTGSFDWIYGQTNAELMSLTYKGNLGVGIINPTEKLHVVGSGTITQNLHVNGQLTVDTAIIGSVQIPELINSNLEISTGITTVVALETISDSGDPTKFSGIIVGAGGSIGIGTSVPKVGLDALEVPALFASVGVNTSSVSTEASLLVNGATIITDAIGVGSITGIPYNGGPGLEIHRGFLDLYDTRVSITSVDTNVTLVVDNKTAVGIGSTQPQAAIDLSGAGKVGNPDFAYMVLPKVTNAEIVGFANTIAGAFVFNTDTGKFQGYTGIGWTNLHD